MVSALHRPLDGLDIQVLLLPRGVVWTHDAHLLPRGNNAREDTAEGIEAALVRGGNHLGDVHHQWCFRVTVLDTCQTQN